MRPPPPPPPPPGYTHTHTHTRPRARLTQGFDVLHGEVISVDKGGPADIAGLKVCAFVRLRGYEEGMRLGLCLAEACGGWVIGFASLKAPSFTRHR